VVNVLRNSSLADTNFFNPANVLGNLNASFPMERHNDMYFTAWYGVYCRSTGILKFSCGGHPPAVLIAPDGTARCLTAKGAVVGAFSRVSYETASVKISPGSRLYLFSDGSYEISRPDSTMMTYEEFTMILKDKVPEKTSKLEAVVAEVRRQQEKDAFLDDFSLLEFRFLDSPASPPFSVSVRNSMEDLPGLFRFTQQFSVTHGIASEEMIEVDLILEEMVTNVFKYGGIPSGADACMIKVLLKGDVLEITIEDYGKPFNPLLLPEVDAAKSIENRPIGGLGIHFVKKLTESQHYEYRDGKNVLKLTKKLRS